METDMFAQHKIKSNLSKALRILKDPQYLPTSENFQVVASVVRNADFFSKKFDLPKKLNEFLHHAKDHFKYEAHPYGSLLLNEKAYTDKFYIILAGNVQKLHQRPHQEVEKEFKSQRCMNSPDRQILRNTIHMHGNENSNDSSSVRKTEDMRKNFHHTNSVKKMSGEVNSDFIRRDATVIGSETSMTLIKQNADLRGKDRKLRMSMDEKESEEIMVEEEEEEELVEESSPSSKGRKMLLKSRSLSNDFEPIRRTKAIPMTCIDVSATNKLREDLQETATLAEIEEKDGQLKPSSANNHKNFIRHVVIKNPELMDRCFLGSTARVYSTQVYGPGDYFGENFCKESQPKEASMIVVSSKMAHFLTISRESYNQIMSRLDEEYAKKTEFFEKLFPVLDVDLIRSFSNFFVQKNIQAGETLFPQSEASCELYLLHTGEITLLKEVDLTQTIIPTLNSLIPVSLKSTKKLEVPLTVVSSGQFFGEEALLKHNTRHYSAVVSSGDVIVYYLEDSLLPKIEQDFGLLFEEITEQAQKKFHWRQQRIYELIQKHQSKDGTFSLIPNVPTNQHKSRTLTIGPTNCVPKEVQALTKKIFHRSRDFEHKSLDNNPNFKSNLMADSALMEEDGSRPKQLQIYKSKFSRRLKMITGPNRDDRNSPVKSPSPGRKGSNEISPAQEIWEFNIRKQLEEAEVGKSSLSKFFVSSSNSPKKVKELPKLQHVRPAGLNSTLFLDSTKFMDLSKQGSTSPIKIKKLNVNNISSEVKMKNKELIKGAEYNKPSIGSFDKFPKNTFEKKRRLESFLQTLNLGSNWSHVQHKSDKNLL